MGCWQQANHHVQVAEKCTQFAVGLQMDRQPGFEGRQAPCGGIVLTCWCVAAIGSAAVMYVLLLGAADFYLIAWWWVRASLCRHAAEDSGISVWDASGAVGGVAVAALVRGARRSAALPALRGAHARRPARCGCVALSCAGTQLMPASQWLCTSNCGLWGVCKLALSFCSATLLVSLLPAYSI